MSLPIRSIDIIIGGKLTMRSSHRSAQTFFQCRCKRKILRYCGPSRLSFRR